MPARVEGWRGFLQWILFDVVRGLRAMRVALRCVALRCVACGACVV